MEREEAEAGWFWGRLLPAVITAAYRLLAATWRVERRGEPLLAEALAEGPVIFCFWHGEQLPLIQAHAHQGIHGVVSRSRDGALLARVLARLGYGLIRGSSSRGGAVALLGAVRGLRQGRSIAVAVDGPRGPRHVVKPGALQLSALGRRPILFAVSHCPTAKALGSWDRFVVPAPFSRVFIAYGRMEPPEDVEAGRAGLAEAMEALGQRLSADGLG
jgi:lysophospholipid acyltransferase (LPLAT)-like uncharacterized protein